MDDAFILYLYGLVFLVPILIVVVWTNKDDFK